LRAGLLSILEGNVSLLQVLGRTGRRTEAGTDGLSATLII
jgi:hypothetical protein